MVSSRKRKLQTPGKPIKSSSDTRSYRIIHLPNGLRAILVSTATTSPFCGDDSKKVFSTGPKDGSSLKCYETSEGFKSVGELVTICVVVNCGTYNDKPSIPGIAHFLDHMLLLGSKKYPGEYEYLQFVCNNAGNLNAFALREVTQFQLEVHDSVIGEAIDRMANLFIEPLFREEAIQHEIHALESEFWLRTGEDSSRLAELTAHLVGKNHPMGLFRWGNMKTLVERPGQEEINLREELLSFFERHYVAENMTLCVMSRNSLDQLEAFVVSSFSALANRRGQPVQRYQVQPKAPPFSQNPDFFKLFKIIPGNRDIVASFQWVLPAQRMFYKEKSLEYITYILSHETRGGLYDHLSRKGWAFRIFAGTPKDSCGDTVFCTILYLEIGLTEEGASEIAAVTKYVHQFLHKMRKTGPQRWLWNELKYAAELSFRFQTPPPAVSLVRDIAVAAQYFPEEHILCHQKMFTNYNPKHIQSLLDLLTADKCNMLFANYQFQSEASSFVSKEPWMGLRWKVEDYPDEWKQSWKDDPHFQNMFRLPGRNPFLARSSKINTQGRMVTYPTVIGYLPERARLWYSMDTRYNQPKCFINLYMMGNPLTSMRCLVVNELVARVLGESLTPWRTYAEIAGIEMSVGLQFIFKGFSETLPLLVKCAIDTLAEFECSDKLFQVVRTGLEREIYNTVRQNKGHADELMKVILHKNYAPYSEKSKILLSLSKQEVVDWARSLGRAFIEMYVHGNISIEQTADLFLHIGDRLDFQSAINRCLRGGFYSPAADQTIPNVLAGEDKVHVRVLSANSAEKCSRIENFYRFGQNTRVDEVMMHLLIAMIKTDCVIYLRVLCQLGYDPECVFRVFSGAPGFMIGVSPMAERFTLSEVDDKIDEFVGLMFQKLSRLNKYGFERARSLLRVVLARPMPPTPDDQYYDNWHQILNGQYVFNAVEVGYGVAELDLLEYDTFKLWAMKALSSSKGGYRKLSVQIVGYGKKALEECEGGEQIWSEYNASTEQDFPPLDPVVPERKILLPKNETKKFYIKSFDAFPRLM